MKSKHVIFRSKKREDGSKGVEAWSPERVVEIHTHEELESQLQHYSQMLSQSLPEDKDVLRHHVELVRPALRFYCKKFQVEPPKWLADDKYFTEHLTDSDRARMFGDKPLRIGEFRNLREKRLNQGDEEGGKPKEAPSGA